MLGHERIMQITCGGYVLKYTRGSFAKEGFVKRFKRIVTVGGTF